MHVWLISFVLASIKMSTTTDWQFQFGEITYLQAQQHYAAGAKRCTQLLAKLPATPTGLLLQVELQSHLVACLEGQARYAEAQTQVKSALAVLDEIKIEHPTDASIPLELKVLSQQGTLARIQGHYAEAEQIFQQAIQLAEAHGLQRHPLRMQCLNNLAIVYKYWGQFDAAENLYEIVLADLIEQHGDHCIEVATIYHNLAGLNHARRHYDAAEPYARKSYQLHLDLLGPHHAQTIADGAALASILHGLEQWDEAISHFEAAIAFFEQQFGPIHYEIAINLNNLAASWQAKGDFTQAEQAYRQALDIKQMLLGSDHPDMAISLNNLAVLLQQTDKRAEAIGLFDRAISIFEATVGPDHPNTQLCRKNKAKYDEK